jgi:hypothetical protein
LNFPLIMSDITKLLSELDITLFEFFDKLGLPTIAKDLLDIKTRLETFEGQLSTISQNTSLNTSKITELQLINASLTDKINNINSEISFIKEEAHQYNLNCPIVTGFTHTLAFIRTATGTTPTQDGNEFPTIALRFTASSNPVTHIYQPCNWNTSSGEVMFTHTLAEGKPFSVPLRYNVRYNVIFKQTYAVNYVVIFVQK